MCRCFLCSRNPVLSVLWSPQVCQKAFKMSLVLYCISISAFYCFRELPGDPFGGPFWGPSQAPLDVCCLSESLPEVWLAHFWPIFGCCLPRRSDGFATFRRCSWESLCVCTVCGNCFRHALRRTQTDMAASACVCCFLQLGWYGSSLCATSLFTATLVYHFDSSVSQSSF